MQNPKKLSVSQIIKYTIGLVFLFYVQLSLSEECDSMDSSHFNFDHFSTVADNDKLNFFDNLKMAGMIFINAPALKKIHVLFAYTDGDISENIDKACSNDILKNIYGLVLSQHNDKYVWRQISFSGACGLRKKIQDLNKEPNACWNPIENAILQSIVNATTEEIDKNSRYIFLIPKDLRRVPWWKMYYAECKDNIAGTFCETVK